MPTFSMNELAAFFCCFAISVQALNNYSYVNHQKNSSEFGSYVNPNPRTPCEGEELQRLNTCISDVLANLDGCKADDLACECCSLQSLSRDCYGLCQGSPSGNFLSALYDDCDSLNDVNACGLPFKNSDGNTPERALAASGSGKGRQKGSSAAGNGNDNGKAPNAVLKSKFGEVLPEEIVESNTINITDTSSNLANVSVLEFDWTNGTVYLNGTSGTNSTNVTKDSSQVEGLNANKNENSDKEGVDEDGEEEEHEYGDKNGNLHRLKQKLNKTEKSKFKSEGSKLFIVKGYEASIALCFAIFATFVFL